jgi:hypothetical protein
MGLIYLNVLFYLTLAMMLATWFQGRGAVLGITLGLLFGPMLVLALAQSKLADSVSTVMPWTLALSFGSKMPLAGYVGVGIRMPTVTPIVGTILWCVLFVGIAIWRFRQEEF